MDDAFSAAVRPFLWLAAIAFAIGFLSYLALGRPAQAQDEAAWREPVSAPVSSAWNTPKEI